MSSTNALRDATGVPSALVGRTRERVARDRRAHDVERVLRIAAVRPRIGERADDVEELDNRSRPSVRDDQRERVGLGRTRVEEVHARAVDLGEEVVERVEPRLGPSPVVLVAPVREQLGEVAELHAVVPAGVGDLFGQTCPHQPFVEVVEGTLGNLDPERLRS